MDPCPLEHPRGPQFHYNFSHHVPSMEHKTVIIKVYPFPVETRQGFTDYTGVGNAAAHRRNPAVGVLLFEHHRIIYLPTAPRAVNRTFIIFTLIDRWPSYSLNFCSGFDRQSHSTR